MGRKYCNINGEDYLFLRGDRFLKWQQLNFCSLSDTPVNQAHVEVAICFFIIFYQSTVNDLNVHKATKEEQVISQSRESVKRFKSLTQAWCCVIYKPDVWNTVKLQWSSPFLSAVLYIYAIAAVK